MTRQGQSRPRFISAMVQNCVGVKAPVVPGHVSSPLIIPVYKGPLPSRTKHLGIQAYIHIGSLVSNTQ